MDTLAIMESVMSKQPPLYYLKNLHLYGLRRTRISSQMSLLRLSNKPRLQDGSEK